MKAKLELSILSVLLSAAAVISCSDDPANPGAPGGSAGQPSGGASGSAGNATAGSNTAGKASGGSAGQTTAGSSGSGSQAGGSAGTGGKGGAGGDGGDAGGGGEGGSGIEAPPIDCSKVPDKPIKVEELTGPRAYHDVAFDGAGNLIGNNNADLLRTMAGGTPKVLLAGVGMVEGMDTFPNGDLVIAATSTEEFEPSLLRITPQGGQSLISGSVSAYGVRIGLDGFIYAGTSEGLLKVDVATGKKVKVQGPDGDWTPRLVDFSPDKKTMYVGTLGSSFGNPDDPVDDLEGGGTVYEYDLDVNGTPVGKPKVFATGVGDGWHDALGVDACGNLFVADYFTTALYRITPDGTVSLYQDWADGTEATSDYGHGLEWGSGVGGWDKNSIYLPQPYDDNTVVRVEVGVPAAHPR